MDNLTKKTTLLFFLFLATYEVYPAKLMVQSYAQHVDYTIALPRKKRKILVDGYAKKYDVPYEVCWILIYYVRDNPMQYKGKKLPDDLSGQDLRGFDFTGCHFTRTNLADTSLNKVILEETTCDYQEAIAYNIKKSRWKGQEYYQVNLPKDLAKISVIYSKLKKDLHKAKLLHIASGISQLPNYYEKEFYIRLKYWFSQLLDLKRNLPLLFPNDQQSFFSLEKIIESEVNRYLWKIILPKDEVECARIKGDEQLAKTNSIFQKYIENFEEGYDLYECESEVGYGGAWYYKQQVLKSIKGLKKAYPKIKSKELKKESIAIAKELSESYKLQSWDLFRCYYTWQRRIVDLEKLVLAKEQEKNLFLYYNDGMSLLYPSA